MTNLPTTQSSITATTAPGSNPVSQALGAGLDIFNLSIYATKEIRWIVY